LEEYETSKEEYKNGIQIVNQLGDILMAKA